MKIAIGVPFDLEKPDASGFLNSFENICNALSENELVIFAPAGGDVRLDSIIDNNVKSLIDKHRNTLELSKDFSKKVQDINPNKILAFTNMGLFLSDKFIYFTSSAPYKKSLRFLENEYPDTGYFNALLSDYKLIAENESKNYEKAEKIIVFSYKIKQDLIEEYNVNPDKIKYIPRSVPVFNDNDIKNDEIMVDRGITKGKKMKIILMPCELRVRKGLKYAIETMKILKKEIPHAVLIICGKINPYEKDYILSLLNQAKGRANIIVAGYLPKKKLYNYMKMADCAFMPFLFDECPIALSECIGYGLPVVTNEYAGYEKEVINQFGYCAARNDINDYVSGIMNMLVNPKFNLEKRKGTMSVAKKFNFDYFKKEINNVFK